jgi:hypothetical protein
MNTIRLALALVLLSAGAAAAQTTPCGGEGPAAGVEIRGPVLHVLDGQTLCVATGSDPSQWMALKLEDAPAASSWGALMSVAFGKDVTCIGQGARRTAICRIEGRPIGAQLDGEATKAGVAWRRPADQPGNDPVQGPMHVAAAGS